MTTSTASNARFRELTALLFFIAFYALNFIIIAVFGHLAWQSLHWPFGLLRYLFTFLFGGVAVLTLWSVVPRVTRFEPGGILAVPHEYPELFEVIRDIARAANQPLPHRVYLTPEINAGVSNVGGLLGLGSRRVLWLGLPLFELLDERELKAVIAHEYGHFLHGDTRLGPWLYRVRAPLARSLGHLRTTERLMEEVVVPGPVLAMMALLALTHLPFEAFARRFARITRVIAHEQEHRADAFAARVVGQDAADRALRRIAALDGSFEGYFATEILPLLDRGYRAPLFEGYRAFLQAPRTTEVASKQWNELRRDLTASASHPAVAARLSDTSVALDFPDVAASDRLVGRADTSDLTYRLMLGKRTTHEDVSWQDSGEVVYRPVWQEHLREHAASLKTLRVSSLPSTCRDLNHVIMQRGLVDPYEGVSGEDYARFARLLGLALGEALARDGWHVLNEPGRPLRLERNGFVVDAQERVWMLVRGAMSEHEWQQWCAERDIPDEPLSA